MVVPTSGLDFTKVRIVNTPLTPIVHVFPTGHNENGIASSAYFAHWRTYSIHDKELHGRLLLWN